MDNNKKQKQTETITTDKIRTMVTTTGTTITTRETTTTRMQTIRTDATTAETARTTTITIRTTTAATGAIKSATHTPNSNGTTVSSRHDVHAQVVPLTMVSTERQQNVHKKSIYTQNKSMQNDNERLVNETPVSDDLRTNTNEALSSDTSDFDNCFL